MATINASTLWNVQYSGDDGAIHAHGAINLAAAQIGEKVRLVKLFAVRYVGKKPTSLDNVAKSGKCWQGNGNVQYVTQGQAKILTGYADQWELDAGLDQAAIDTPVIHAITDDAGGAVVIAEQDLSGPLEKMTVAELVAYAQVTYGKQLNPKQGRKLLLDEVMLMDGVVDQGKLASSVVSR